MSVLLIYFSFIFMNMNLQENILRIKEMMGVLTEQSLQKVEIEGRQPKSKPDLDLVHGYFGSKRLQDDLEERVSKALTNGNYRVENVVISTQIEGNDIVTRGTVTIRPVKPNEKPHKYFTTRGSIGGDYQGRHDQQVSGLVDRLKVAYKTDGVKQFGPFVVNIKGTNISYKQSFFAIEGPSTATSSNTSNQTTNTTQTNQKVVVRGKDLNDLREKLKQQTQNISMDTDSITVDMKSYTVSFDKGNEQVKVVSLIFDDRGQLDSRLHTIKQKNPTMELMESGKIGNIDWVILVIR